jgi:cytochrome P450
MSEGSEDGGSGDSESGDSEAAGDERFPNGAPPGPDRLPVVGNALPFFRRPFEYRTWVAEEFGDVADVSGLGRTAFLVSHPEDIQQVLVTDDHQFVKPSFEKRFVARAFGESLAFVDGEQWRRARQLFQPAFTMAKIERYGATMVDNAEALAADWPATGRVDIGAEMRELTFAVLARTLFDVDTAAIPDLHDDFEAVATKLRPARAVVPDWLPTGTNRRYKRALARLEATIDDLVAQRKGEGGDGDDLLSVLVAANDEGDATLSDERLRDEMMGFLFAGHETTAMALTFTCYLLATHPDVQRRLREEIAAVLKEERPTVTDLAGFDLLDRVVDESLRLYPPNHMIPREPTTDVALGGYRIPEGSSVYCSQWVVHRDERWWDSPGQFRPDRWTGEADRPEYAYFPFGGGRRHCIGMRFARMEIRLALARILSTHRFTGAPSGDPPLAAGLTLHPSEPIELGVEREAAGGTD